METIVFFGAGEGSLGGNVKTLLTKETLIKILVYDLKDGYDFRTEETAKKAFREIELYVKKEKRNIRAMVNFIGVMDNCLIEDLNIHKFIRISDTNILTYAIIAKYAAQWFKKKKYGRFIQIGSVSAVVPFSGMSAYSSSKSACSMFTKVFAREMAKYNVPVNQINPTAFTPESSNMSKNQIEQFMKINNITEEQTIKLLTSKIPMKRLATIEDLTAILFYLIYDAPIYLTGQNINLSGGMF